MDPTERVPDFVVTVRIEGAYAIAEVRATTDVDITVAMSDLHRYTIDALREFTWPRGYNVIETRWADVETVNGRVETMTAMALLYDRTDGDWDLARIAVEQDQQALRELREQAAEITGGDDR